MTLDSCHAHRMPPPETSTFRRQNSWLGSKSAGDSPLKGTQASKLARDARRRRLELRRIRSFSQAVSASDPSPIDVDKQEEAINDEATSLVLGEERRRAHGKISVVGRRREMDDAVAVELGFLKTGGESYDFFGVFNGREERRVARACSHMLPPTLAQIVDEESTEKEIDWEEVMKEGFHEVEAKMHENGAAAAVVGDTKVVVAGWDTKAVLCRGGVAVRLLDVGDKLEREVKVRVVMRSRADEFLILGSEGFWSVMSDEMACQIAGRYCSGGRTTDHVDDRRSGGAEAAAALMAEVAVAQGSKDNVSIVLVDLRGTDDESTDVDGN